jgi:hypothetical protein
MQPTIHERLGLRISKRFTTFLQIRKEATGPFDALIDGVATDNELSDIWVQDWGVNAYGIDVLKVLNQGNDMQCSPSAYLQSRTQGTGFATFILNIHTLSVNKDFQMTLDCCHVKI